MGIESFLLMVLTLHRKKKLEEALKRAGNASTLDTTATEVPQEKVQDKTGAIEETEQVTGTSLLAQLLRIAYLIAMLRHFIEARVSGRDT